MRRSHAIAGAAALLLAGSRGARADAPIPLRVATTPNDSGAEVYYAQDMGFFKKYGLDVTITTLNNGGIIASGVSSGSFEVAQAALSSVASAHDRGVPFVIIAPAALWTSARVTSALVVAGDATIQTAKDLEGKIVAVNGLQNVTQVGPEAWLAQNGADPAKVKFIEMPFAEMTPALEAHRIDAAQLSQPALGEALRAGGRILAPTYDAIAKQFLLAGWFSTPAWVQANPDAAKRFTAAILETAKWANANPALSAKILEKYTKLPVDPGTPRVLYPERTRLEEAQPLIDASAQFHALSKTFPAKEIFAPL
jgi:NitT/TauT family transport system substrate-binding protein